MNVYNLVLVEQESEKRIEKTTVHTALQSLTSYALDLRKFSMSTDVVFPQKVVERANETKLRDMIANVIFLSLFGLVRSWEKKIKRLWTDHRKFSVSNC